MRAVKAKYDGKQIILPKGFEAPAGSEVVVIFDMLNDEWDTSDSDYLAAAAQAFAKVWDNPDDEVFNSM